MAIHFRLLGWSVLVAFFSCGLFAPIAIGVGDRVGLTTGSDAEGKFGLSYYEDIGAGWIRANIAWNSFEPYEGVFSTSRFDAFVEDAHDRGLKIYATLVYTPPWASDSGIKNAVPAPEDWYNFVHTVATRYSGKIQAYGMWNEPNLAFWGGTRQQYIDIIVKQGADAVHAADTNALVAAADLSQYEIYDWRTWSDDVFAQAGDKIDIYTQHVYADTPEGVAAELTKLKPYFERHGKPFWLTEIGWQDPDDPVVAGYFEQVLSDILLEDSEFSWVDKIFFYNLQDNVGGGIYNLLDENNNPRLAYSSLKNFIEANTVPEPASILLLTAGGLLLFKRNS